MGWHIPDDNEWYILINFLGGANVAGGKLKDQSTAFWIGPNSGATNLSGFSGLPGGMANYWDCNFAGFEGPGNIAGFWSSTSSYDPEVQVSGHSIFTLNSSSSVIQHGGTESGNGVCPTRVSARCLKD